MVATIMPYVALFQGTVITLWIRLACLTLCLQCSMGYRE